MALDRPTIAQQPPVTAATAAPIKPVVEQFVVPMEASQLLFQLTLKDCPDPASVESQLFKLIETNRTSQSLYKTAYSIVVII